MAGWIDHYATAEANPGVMTPEEKTCAMISSMCYHPLLSVKTPLGTFRKVAEGCTSLNGRNMVSYTDDEKYFIVGFRGTDITNLGDLVADGGILLFGQLGYLPQGYADVIVENGKDKQILFTGHSLGGMIATTTFKRWRKMGLSARAHVFNAGTGIPDNLIGIVGIDLLVKALGAKAAGGLHHHILGCPISMGAHPFETRTYNAVIDCGKHDLANFIPRSDWVAAGIRIGDMGLSDQWLGWETFRKVQGEDGTFALKTIHGTYLSVQSDGALTQACQWSGWETFRQEGGGERSALQAVCHGGRYLSAQPGGGFQLAGRWAGAWETFHIHGTDDKLAIQTCHGKFLCARQGHDSRPPLQACAVVDGVRGGWETFTKEPGPDGTFALKTFHDSFLCAKPDGSLTQAWEWSAWETFRQEGGGEKTAFRTVCHGDRYLSAKPDGSFQLADQWSGWETFHIYGTDGNLAIRTVHGRFLSAPIDTARWH